MNETTKTKQVRHPDFYKEYLSGKVIDIGAGGDLVVQGAESFDVEDGDANWITRYRSCESYDAVHSSHCLEHMNDPIAAIHQWLQICRKGGYLIVVVPDEDLYEQGFWPSKFNPDHKSTFKWEKGSSWSPVSFNLCEIFEKLHNVEIISYQRHDFKYNHQLKVSYPPRQCTEPYVILFSRRVIRKLFFFMPKLSWRFENFSNLRYLLPIDQTARDALAQIQIVVRKI
jgi:SAM-dependent methyltransferase